jgi:formate/nitrite transporter
MTDTAQFHIDPLLPAEIARRAEDAGVTKARLPALQTLVLAVLAGAFISLGAQFFTIVTTASGLGFGPARLLGGVAFSLGLFLVVVAGAELFTGNNLIVMAWASGKVSAGQVLRNWCLVYAGNFAGALATALLMYLSRQWELAGNAVGANALNIAAAKVNLDVLEALARGVLCNSLVCLAVWLCYSSRSNTDKFFAVVFPITAFVASGFEHSIANMYFVPLGMLLSGEPSVTAVAGLTGEALVRLTWADFLLRNLLPVTLGNIAGGAGLVGAIYWFIYLRPAPNSQG